MRAASQALSPSIPTHSGGDVTGSRTEYSVGNKGTTKATAVSCHRDQPSDPDERCWATGLRKPSDQKGAELGKHIDLEPEPGRQSDPREEEALEQEGCASGRHLNYPGHAGRALLTCSGRTQGRGKYCEAAEYLMLGV